MFTDLRVWPARRWAIVVAVAAGAFMALATGYASDQVMKALETNGTLTRHQFHPEWNYTLNPTE